MPYQTPTIAVLTADQCSSMPIKDQKTRWEACVWDPLTVNELIAASDEYIFFRPHNSTHKRLVHQDLFCHFSDFHVQHPEIISSLSNGKLRYINAQIDDSTLKMFIGWIYTGRLHETACKTEEGEHQTVRVLVDLYIFAHEMSITALRRAIMTRLCENEGLPDMPTYETVALVFAELPERSGMRQYMIDSYANHWLSGMDRGLEKGWYAEVPPGFGYEVMRSQSAMLENGKLEECDCCNDPCAYHEHESEEEHLATCGADEGEGE